MSRGMTIADFVQQVFYAIYKTRLDTTFDPSLPQAFHASTDKFKEILMEGNFVLQELQKEQDWNWLRDRVVLGVAEDLGDQRIVEYPLPARAYKVCTGYNDAVRLHDPNNYNIFMEVPFTSPRSGSVNQVVMFDSIGQLNARDTRLQAFVVGDHVTFTRPFSLSEIGATVETDIVELLEPLHICSSACVQPCPQAYEDLVFTRIPDPYYMVARTAARRAEGDPSASDRLMSLTDEASKLLSAMRENDSSKTVPDTYQSIELGHLRVL